MEVAGPSQNAVTGKRPAPAVSVIIPSFNCAALLPKAIESALAQTYTEIEIIVIDDGSTDGTAAAVAPYLDRVQFIRQDNRGLPGARNSGIRRARGEFLALLDSDDSWLPQKLALQMPRFRDPAVDIVYSDFAVEYADGRYKPSYLAERPLAAEGRVFDRYIQSRFLFPSTMVLRASAVRACGLFDEEMVACEDIELFGRMCLHAEVAWVREPLMIRTESGSGITGNADKMSRYTILALRKILAREPDLLDGSRRVVEHELGKQLLWRAYTDYSAGRFGLARRQVFEAARFDSRGLLRTGPMLPLLCLPNPLLRSVLRRLRSGRAT